MIAGGYVAAIFSANYAGSLHRHPAAPEDLHSEQTEARKLAQVYARVPKTGSAMASLQTANGPLTKAKSAVGANTDFETINTWELMQDLNEQESSSDVESYDPTHIATTSEPTTSLLNRPSHDPIRSTASSNGAFAELIPRSKSLTSFHISEDGKVCLAASKDVASTLAEPSLRAVMQGVNSVNVNEAMDFSRLTLRKLFKKMYRGDLVSEDDGLSVPYSDNGPARERLNIQRALSMKYILNDNTSGENDQSIFSDTSKPTACVDEAKGNGSATFSCEAESSSSLLSPQLSATASLKDWLLSESPSITRTPSSESDFFFEATEASHTLSPQQTTAYLRPNTRRLLSKYVGGGELEHG